MKKVLFLIESLRIGGAEKALVSLLKNLDTSKYDITVLCIADSGYLSELIRLVSGIKYTYIASSKSTFFDKIKIKMIYRWLSPKMIYKLFIPHNFDVEIAFCEGFSTKIIGASTNKKIKRIAWVHTDLLENNWPVNNGTFADITEEILCYETFDYVIGVSDTVCNRLKSLLNNKNINRVYNLIDNDEIIEKSLEKTKYISVKGRVNIVSVGRLEFVKGYDRLITVIARLVHNDGLKDITLTLVGDGTERQNLINLINKNKLEDIVTLCGMQKNPYAIMKDKDLFVCPSRNEGFNIAMAEAIILGLPIVSTWCPGPNEILQDGKYGILCENSEEGLYKALKELLNRTSLLDKLSELSVERQLMFDKEEILEKIYKLI